MNREIASPLSMAVLKKQQEKGDKNPTPPQPARTQVTRVSVRGGVQ